MTLRKLLTVSHLGVVAIFLFVFGLAFAALFHDKVGARPGNREAERVITEFLSENHSDKEIVDFFLSLGFDDSFSLHLFSSQGEVRKICGADDNPTLPSFIGELSSGRQVIVVETDGKAAQWLPLDLAGPRSHYLRIGNRELPQELLRATAEYFLIASCVASLCVVLAAIFFAGVLARPLRLLAETADDFGRISFEPRAHIGGPKELRELGTSFNNMADFIQQNTTDLRLQKEKAEDIEASRRQFLADVSHNLRTPLAAALGWTDALIEGVAEDENIYRTRIRRELVHVTRIVERMLELSRWEQAAPLLKLEEVVLSELLLEVAENLEEPAQKNEIRLEFEGLDPQLRIRADRQKARDILQILLENVVQHAGPGTEAKVSVKTTDQRVLVTVKDNGQGFPQEFLSDPQLERGTNDAGQVSLGLAIASRLTTAHGGELRLSNDPEGGAHARVDFDSV